MLTPSRSLFSLRQRRQCDSRGSIVSVTRPVLSAAGARVIHDLARPFAQRVDRPGMACNDRLAPALTSNARSKACVAARFPEIEASFLKRTCFLRKTIALA